MLNNAESSSSTNENLVSMGKYSTVKKQFQGVIFHNFYFLNSNPGLDC